MFLSFCGSPNYPVFGKNFLLLVVIILHGKGICRQDWHNSATFIGDLHPDACDAKMSSQDTKMSGHGHANIHCCLISTVVHVALGKASYCTTWLSQDGSHNLESLHCVCFDSTLNGGYSVARNFCITVSTQI